MNISRRNLMHILAAAVASVGLVAMPTQAADKPQVGVVVKIGGIPWFNAMEAGIKKAAPEVGAEAWMIGPTQADAAQQVRAVEDLIARKVSVIAVVPNDAKALEPVFKRA
jgi:simple sugar transport system substrate-binding protein